MTKKKACKKCKIFVEGDKCPICQNSNFSNSWNGRMYVIDSNKSHISKQMGLTMKGEYAIKIK
ncbi:DNA-directed RNA polymerase subunit E'' [Candidatus Woesearchaeota archaeon]|nr:DNA-directed RNA polymerase subunit E'' [Candidatus Woesearchaeota archaeon]